MEFVRCDPAEAIGTPLARFIPPRQQQRHAEHVEGFAKTDTTNRPMGTMHVLHGVRADGEAFPIEAAISRLGEGADGALMTVVLRDVTDARRTATALEAQRAAEAASRAKTEFLARMSHELRTPLNAVLGFAQLLQGSGEPLTERQRVQIDHIRLAGWYQLALISDVLDVSRIEAGALQIAIAALDAEATAADAIALSRSLAERHGVRLHGPVGSAGCTILADATRWRQILLNVLSNAIKYNDVSVRDWQFQSPTWMMGKGFETHGPTGPWLVTRDEVPDPAALRLRTWVTGALKQDASTGEMIFTVADVREYLSQAFTLEPGDVIFTGTPSGVGPVKRGDELEGFVEGVGSLRLRVV